jgi:RNA polymerase sigma-70 factor, ECF subfamily
MATLIMSFSAMMADDRKALAAGLRRRDPELLDLLIEQYQYRLFRYVLYLTGSREIAEDLFQETWIRVLDRGHQYDGKAKFETWLFAIARHLVIDLQRRKKPESLDSLDSPEMIAAEPSPLEQFSRQEREADLQESLGRLPAVYREVLLLRFQEDLALDEIAAVLDAPVSTVKSRLYRGLEVLRQELGEAGHAG